MRRRRPGSSTTPRFVGWGAFAGYDTRDLPRGPRRGGFYGIEFRRYMDMDRGHLHPSPAGARGPAVLPVLQRDACRRAVRKARFAYAGATIAWSRSTCCRKLGGNFELRGFNQYRFHDNNAFMAAIEHRWYAFSGLEMALFVDAGKTVPKKGQVDFSGLNYSGGIGLRVRIAGAVVLRMDVAKSREGIRWIWSMSDVSRRRF